MTQNEWNEPSGREVIERGDLVRVTKGTTEGFVIGVTTCKGTYNCARGHQEATPHLISMVLTKPECFLEQFPAHELTVIKKGVR